MKAGEQLALIALGSNLGESARIIRQAFEDLEKISIRPIVRSSLWQSSPVDCPPDSPMFVNAAAAIVPNEGETPESLLARLQALEKQSGRQMKSVQNEARPLDLDLIAFGTERRETAELTIPHARAHLRQFVLRPLSEIAPEFVLPGFSQTVRQLLDGLKTEELLTLLEPSAPE